MLVNGERSEGIELGISGRVTSAWGVMGGYAYQDGSVTQADAGKGQQPGQFCRTFPVIHFPCGIAMTSHHGWALGSV